MLNQVEVLGKQQHNTSQPAFAGSTKLVKLRLT